MFQWLESNQTLNLSEEKLTHVKEEVADIAIYLIRVCMAYNIDLENAIFEKMKKNELKYPLVDKEGNKINYKKN
ncbi:MazG-like family protein [Malaciobacter mytili]|uniref:MazG-like family protein n=1 Tax=Malaciobacter mytili TaxID=603050 RepID=UPI003A847503